MQKPVCHVENEHRPPNPFVRSLASSGARAQQQLSCRRIVDSPNSFHPRLGKRRRKIQNPCRALGFFFYGWPTESESRNASPYHQFPPRSPDPKRHAHCFKLETPEAITNQLILHLRWIFVLATRSPLVLLSSYDCNNNCGPTGTFSIHQFLEKNRDPLSV